LRAIQLDSSSGSNAEATQVDAEAKLQTWKEVPRGKSRGRVYGTGDSAANYHQGVSSLTQPSSFASASDFSVYTAREEEMDREIVQAKEEVRTKIEQARTTTEQARTVSEKMVTAIARVHQLDDNLRMIKEQLVAMMERQHGDASTSTSQIHPHYAEDDDHHPLP